MSVDSRLLTNIAEEKYKFHPNSFSEALDRLADVATAKSLRPGDLIRDDANWLMVTAQMKNVLYCVDFDLL